MTAGPPSRAERLGRRAGIVLFGLIVGGFTLVCTAQILHTLFFAPPKAQADGCRPAALDLIAAVRRARAAAGAEIRGERAAVLQFRASLEPEWSQREALDLACQGDPQALRALREIDRFRYAEEHAARYEAVDLAKRRRRMLALEAELSKGGGSRQGIRQ